MVFILQDSCRWLRKRLHVLLSCLLSMEESFSSSSNSTSVDSFGSSLPVLSNQDGWNLRVEVSELARKAYCLLQSLSWFQTDQFLPTLPLAYYSCSSSWVFSRQPNRLTSSNLLCVVQLCTTHSLALTRPKCLGFKSKEKIRAWIDFWPLNYLRLSLAIGWLPPFFRPWNLSVH